ncbi:hypothetical protein ES705_28297 [subsurface metagenome]
MAVEGNYIKENDVDNWPADVTQTEMQEIIDRVERTVERITKDYFYPKTFHEFSDGNGRDRLFFPIRQKILSINYLAVNTIVLSTTDLTGTKISGTAGEYTVTLTIKTTADYYKNYYLGIEDNSESVNNLWGCRILSNTVTGEDDKATFTLDQPLEITLEEADTVSLITNWDYDANIRYP